MPQPDSVEVEAKWNPFPEFDVDLDTFQYYQADSSGTFGAQHLKCENQFVYRTEIPYFVPAGTRIHEEVRLHYLRLGITAHVTGPQIKDYIAGIAAIPRRLRVTVEGTCLPPYVNLIAKIAGVSNKSGGESLNGTYNCRWNSGTAQWEERFIVDHAGEPVGYNITISCEEGVGYYGAVTSDLFGPIGGGLGFMAGIPLNSSDSFTEGTLTISF